jgi:hypothetical protein
MRSLPALAKRLLLVQLLLLALAASLGCKGSSPGGDPGAASASLAAKPHPSSAVEAESLKKAGTSWTNEEIRIYYNQVVSTIGPKNEAWKAEGVPLLERARRSFEIRHDARLTCRAMMGSVTEVDMLRKRDQEKYGNPDGPTFEQLVEHENKKGGVGDTVFEGIIQSSQKTDEGVNRAFGIQRSP